jgi:hypothetical protein
LDVKRIKRWKNLKLQKIENSIKAGLGSARTKKLAFSMRNPVLGRILAFLGKNTALRARSTLTRVWGIRFSEQNFYSTSIYMLTRDRKNEGKFFCLLKLAYIPPLHKSRAGTTQKLKQNQADVFVCKHFISNLIALGCANQKTFNFYPTNFIPNFILLLFSPNFIFPKFSIKSYLLIFRPAFPY